MNAHITNNKAPITGYGRLIKPLERNPEFGVYLKSLKSCLKHHMIITPLKAWWDNNNHTITYGNVLIDYTSLLELINITNPSKTIAHTNPGGQGQASSKTAKKAKPLYPQLPWVNELFLLSKDSHISLLREFFSDYSEYLATHEAETRKEICVIPKVIHLVTGTPEHHHLLEISNWVSNKSNIVNCQLVFDAILEIHNPAAVDSGDVFRAATLCPHNLFKLFMMSDFTGYDFENGKALIHLLSLPLSIDKWNDYGQAHMHPDYPFFNNSIFSHKFNVALSDLPQLTSSWNDFYERYSTISWGPINENMSYGGGSLFALTVGSLSENGDTPNASEISEILNQTQPNIWCVQHWIHADILDTTSPQWRTARLNLLGDFNLVPEFVNYFFVVAQYVLDKDMTDLSSRILITGLIHLILWSKGDKSNALPVIQEYFPVIYNHRRTETFREMIIYIRSRLISTTITNNALTIPLAQFDKFLEYVIFQESLPQVIAAETHMKAISHNRPIVSGMDMNILDNQAYTEDYVASFILMTIGALLNSNGGDIIITLPSQNNGNKFVQPLLSALSALEYSAKMQGYDCVVTSKAIEESSGNHIIWLKCYRSSRPVFINKNGLPGGITSITPDNKYIYYHGNDATNILGKRYSMIKQRHSIVLSC